MTERATCWSVTINNPTSYDEDCITEARSKGWSVEGQKEQGKEGTEHYQLMVRTPQVRFSALKKAFPRAHIQVARNPTALKQYVHKEDTKVSDLSDTPFISPTKLMDMFGEWVLAEYRTYADNYYMWMHGRELVRFDDFIISMINHDMNVELLAVNPQIRAAVKRFGTAIVTRSLRRQKDRQTAQNITFAGSISDGDSVRTPSASSVDKAEDECSQESSDESPGASEDGGDEDCYEGSEACSEEYE